MHQLGEGIGSDWHFSHY